jgi:4-amino-4-deoxy-L-arabinose transferase-like glycosyltransferase
LATKRGEIGSRMSDTRRASLLPLFAVFLAWFLGLWSLADQSMWVDEWFTNYNIGRSWADFLPSVIATERRPPLHFALLKLWSSLAGNEELPLRLYSAAMVALSVALLYALGRRLLDRRAAAAATFLLAISPFWLLYGRMIRAYSQTMMLSLGATLLLVIAIGHAGTRRAWWVAYALAASALIYTDYSGLPILAAHGVYILTTWRAARLRSIFFWLIAMAAVGVAYLAWLPSILSATDREVRLTDLAGGPVGFAVKLAVPFYVWSAGETLYPWSYFGLGVVTAIIMGLLAAWGFWRTGHTRPPAAVLLLAWLLLPLLFTATLLSLVATDITFLNAASRTPGSVPAYLLAVAAGWAALPRCGRWRFLRGAALVLILAGALVSTANYFGGRQFLNPIYALPTRAVVQEVARQAGPGDLILAERDTLLGHYYTQTSGVAAYQDVDPPANLRWIDQHAPPAIWLVTFGRDSTEGAFGTPDLLAALAPAYRLAAEEGYGPVEPTYAAIKQRITGRPSYTDKLKVQRYTRSLP